MTELFRGYIKTVGKKAVDRFKNKSDLRTYDEVKKFKEFAGVLAENVIMIDVDDYEQSEMLMNIVEEKQLRCRVYETTRGKHFYFINKGVDSCKTHTKVACGLTVDIKIGKKNSYDALKVNGKEREIIYDIFENEDYEELPNWLLPIKSNVDLICLEAGDGRNQALFGYILTLQNADYTKDEIKSIIRLINAYMFKEPLSDEELEVILRDESFKPKELNFFNSKGSFLFDEFAKFLVKNYNIIKIDNQLYLYRDGIYINGNGEIENLMIKHVPNLNKQKRNEVLSYMDIMIRENTKPSSASYIAFKNGIYNIDTDDFSDFTPELVITNKINFNFNPNAKSDIVDKSLNDISCNDSKIRALLEELVGYCFYRRNELRKAFILTGDKRNGKSTFLSMVQKLLGDENTCSLDLKELGDRFKTAELHMKLANVGDDIGDDFISNPAIFKKLVSGDRINAERKGQDPFDFNPYAKQLFSANDIPRIKDKSGAVIDRLVIVPFNAIFSKDDPDYDPYIKYKLTKEDSLEYLIILGIEGLKRVLSNQGFTESVKVKKEIEEYEENNNPILMFLHEIEPESILNESTKAVYQKYCEFCLNNGLQSLSNVEFSRQIKKRLGYEIVTKSIKGIKYRIFVRR